MECEEGHLWYHLFLSDITGWERFFFQGLNVPEHKKNLYSKIQHLPEIHDIKLNILQDTKYFTFCLPDGPNFSFQVHTLYTTLRTVLPRHSHAFTNFPVYSTYVETRLDRSSQTSSVVLCYSQVRSFQNARCQLHSSGLSNGQHGKPKKKKREI